ncbi:MAG TPA: imelysin family protein [Thermomicrobiales bacterium]|nr:imelysin family protein [Thermomicrobiales bacterium]
MAPLFSSRVTRRSTLGFGGAAVAAISFRTVRAQEANPAPLDLTKVKAYVTDQAAQMKTGAESLKTIADRYYDLALAQNFDYQTMLDANAQEVPGLMAAAKDAWLVASTHYELNEGLVAGVPSLAHFDLLIDAGPSATEDPEGALDWTLDLPNGEQLVKPGNIFHNLTEPAIWGTDDTFVALRVDLDGDGDTALGDVLPEANLFKAAADILDSSTADMQAAIAAWEPSIEDAFTALVTMIPTMAEYFEQWRLSAFVTGADTTTEKAFVATSRLFDVNGIVHGLDVTYEVIRITVSAVDTELDTRIKSGFRDLVQFVEDLYAQEQGGKRFSPDEAELYGTEATDKSTALVGLVSQAVALLKITV